MNGDLEQAFSPVLAAPAGLPEVEQSTSYGTPALKVRGKLIARLKDADTLVLRCPMEEKEVLLDAEPAIFFETPHYHGWSAILIRLAAIDPDHLRHHVARAWRMQAPCKLAAAFEAAALP